MQVIAGFQAEHQPAALRRAARLADELLLFEAHNTLVRLLQEAVTGNPVPVLSSPMLGPTHLTPAEACQRQKPYQKISQSYLKADV